MTRCINLLQPDSRYVHLSLLHGQVSASDAITYVTVSDVCASVFLTMNMCVCIVSVPSHVTVMSVSFSDSLDVLHIM